MTRVRFEHLSRDELDAQLAPSRTAKDPWGVIARHESETAALDGAPGVVVTRDVEYGSGARQRFDVVRPAEGGGQIPALVFVHGGFWQIGNKAWSGFAARSMGERGWAHVAIGYTLAPEARLRDIVAEIAAALHVLRERSSSFGIDAGRLVLVGHSAGAHLAAAMLAGVGGEAAVESVSAAILISGVYDLAPVAASQVNDLVAMDDRDVQELSPLLRLPSRDVPVRLVIGADEPAAFHAQTDALHMAWSPELATLQVDRVIGRDHFDVLDELTDPESSTTDFLRTLFR